MAECTSAMDGSYLAALLLGLCVFYFILPRYERLAEEQKQVLNTQNQIIKAYQTTPLSLSDIRPFVRLNAIKKASG